MKIGLLIAQMPHAVRCDSLSDNQMTFLSPLGGLDAYEAATLTLRAFGRHAEAYAVREITRVTFSGSSPMPMVDVRFPEKLGELARRFYNALPERLPSDANALLDVGREVAASLGFDLHEVAPHLATENQHRVEYADFLDALAKGRVMRGPGKRMKVSNTLLTRWNVPVYDFVHTLDAYHPEFVGEEDLSALIEIAEELGVVDTYPHPEFVVMFAGTPGVTLIRVDAGDEKAAFECFYYSFRQRLWTAVKRTQEDLFGCVEDMISYIAAWRADVQFVQPNPRPRSENEAFRDHLTSEVRARTRVIHLSEMRRIASAARSAASRAHHEKGRHERRLCDREIVRTVNGKEVRYRLKRAGEIITVKPDAEPARTMRGQPAVRLAPAIYEVRA